MISYVKQSFSFHNNVTRPCCSFLGCVSSVNTIAINMNERHGDEI